ncbi:MAG TPA: HAMP domain-containing sensor histidine kinase [Blastocatellia bacterium]|nr:HAMP domain-containing sensor histidine kinase [Blastocatellia bacterium]
MKLAKRKPSLMLLLVAALIALLPLLAVLQFRWLGEVSRAERERMQASLKSAVANFSRDFDGELTRAYLNFQTDAKTLRGKAWQDYSRRYDQWFRAAPYPQIIANIFLVEPDEAHAAQLARFNRAATQFEPASWPAQFESLRQQFDDEFKGESNPAKPFMRASVDTLVEDGPALTIPIPDSEILDNRDITHPKSFPGYVVVTLDLDFIKQQFIPALAARYFANDEQFDYSFAIVSRREPEKIIYRSDNSFPEDKVPTGDATANIFNVRLDMPMLAESNNGEIETSDAGIEKRDKSIVRVFNTVVTKGAEPNRSSPRIAMVSGEGELWQIILKHRAGSLDAAVAVARRRNLAISFGILLLLSVSVAMIIISTRRAQAVARQQMEFVAGVSHEMRTPLAVICSAGENLADGVIDERQQVRRYGALIESEGRRLSEMIEQALEFAGVQRGRKNYALRPADVGSAIESAIAACAPLIQEGEFKIEKEIADDLPVIAADNAALSRSIQNLLNNAMKYSGESLLIKIKAERVATGRGDEAQITIEDRGLGITPAELPHVFEPFFRGRAVVDAQIRGSGLGLSLVKHIIEAHGGRVTVKSAERLGSAFTIHLPAATGADELTSDVHALGKQLTTDN